MTLLVVAALFMNVNPALAVPQSKLAKARAVKAQVESLDRRVEVAAERYNLAASRHVTLLAQKRKATAKYHKVKKRMGVVQGHLNTRANSMYRKGPMGFTSVLLGAESFEEFAATWDVLAELNSEDAESVAELKVLRAKAKKARAEVTAKEEAAADQVRVMRANKRSIETQLASRKRKLRGIEAEIKRIQDAEEAAAAARASSSGSYYEGNWDPPSSSKGANVVETAKTRLGAPYVWAADGPNSFDCSGLVVWVFRQHGVSLPHHSGSQINSGSRVSRSNLEPGDLVFFGSPIHHVGIYVGGGMFIHAPHTGDVVKISSLAGHGGYSGACRINVN